MKNKHICYLIFPILSETNVFFENFSAKKFLDFQFVRVRLTLNLFDLLL
jgi:hypothetical protein